MGSSSSKPRQPSLKAAALGPNVLTSVENAKVDVIFLHGLTGHREKTWTAEGESDPWPKSLLPKDLPTARIITYGYDADVLNLTRVAGQNTVREHAKTLINDLSALRTDTVGRPIIFVVHSLGGLVIQEALLICSNPNDEAQSDILSSTHGVAFLGTPHAGAGLEKFATAVANIVSLVKKPNKKLLGVLRKNSETLANIKDGFHIIVSRRHSSSEPIELHVFLEELPVDFLRRRVVEPDSAKLPGYNYDTIPANHMDMTKFRTASDVGYIRVLNRLKRWIGDDVVDDDSISMNYTKQLRDALKVEFAASDPPALVQEICNSSEIEQSLEWLMNSSEYRVWKKSSSSKLLIHGQRRDGKTVAMSYVLKSLDLEPQFGRERDIVSIFCSNKDSELEMVASLACQVLQKNNSRVKEVRKKFPISKFGNHGQANALWELLRSSILAVSKETVFIIDGIDKLGKRARLSFLEHFRQIENEMDTNNMPMRILISSETMDDIMSKLAHYSSIDREKERRECLKTLAFEEWNARESRVEDVEDGGKWLASHPQYTKWSEDSIPSALWLEGKPGSGKSTLAKRIIGKLEDGEKGPSRVQLNDTPLEKQVWSFDNPRDKSTIVARFYYSFRGGNTETSHELMLRSIVYQIWRDNSQLYPLLSNRFRELQRSREDWNYKDFKLALRSLHQIDFYLKIVIVVDGMDESDSDKRADILSFLPDLAVPNSKCIVKVLIASRPESDINFRLKRACLHHIKLQDVNEEDIRLAVEKWIKRMEIERGCEQDTFEFVKDYILKSSSGVFLWVALVLREMEICLDNGLSSKADLDKIVLQLPKELGGEHGFYKRMLLPLSTNCEEDLYQQDRRRRIFYWVTFPKRPILVGELQDVLATPLPSQEMDLSSYNLLDNRPLEVGRGILSACGGLVEVRDSYLGRVVQLIHQTAREFLLKEIAKPYYLTEADGDVEIATTCCRIICIVFSAPVFQMEADDNFSGARVMAKHLSKCELLIYALTNFTNHLDHLNKRKEEILFQFERFITKLSERLSSYACLLLSQWINSNLPKDLHVITDETAMKSCIQATLAHADDTEMKGNLIQILTALQPNLLHFEVEAGNKKTAQLLLLHRGSDFGKRDNNGQTPLWVAARYGHIEIVELLFEYGSDPNERDNNGQTPLWIAARYRHSYIVVQLLRDGSDPNERDNNGQTPLWIAARYGHIEIARDLLHGGGDPNERDNNGETPISIATKHRYKDLVKLLESKKG